MALHHGQRLLHENSPRTTHDKTSTRAPYVSERAGRLNARGSYAAGSPEVTSNSIRRIDDWGQFASAIKAVAGPTALAPVETAQSQVINGGHTVRQVSVRIGQPAFRAELIRRYGLVCAFTGPAPAEALEACHLYSYAEIGRHHADGGLLLRRDLHRLFDQGLLAVNGDGTVDVVDSLKGYELYGALQGKALQVSTTPAQRDWLATHWAEFRLDSGLGA